MMTSGEYYARCARLAGYTYSPVTMTFVYYQTYLAKIEEEKMLPGFSLKRSKKGHKNSDKKG